MDDELEVHGGFAVCSTRQVTEEMGRFLHVYEVCMEWGGGGCKHVRSFEGYQNLSLI